METRANYLIVGLFVILGMTGLLASAIWIAGSGGGTTRALYDVYFEGSVAGLRPGNPVQYRGIPVGVVADMRIDPENVERILVTLDLDSETPVKTDTEAMLAMQGITGIAYIELAGGTRAAETLRAAPGRDRPVIASRPSQISELIEAAPELVHRTMHLLEQAEILLGPENQARFATSLDNVEKLTGTLADSSGDIAGILKEGAATATALRETVERANRMLAALEKESGGIATDSRQVLADTRRAVTELASAAEQLSGFLKDNREPLSNFSSTGLYEFSQLLAESRALVSALNRLAGQFERDPARFLFGDQQQGVEVK